MKKRLIIIALVLAVAVAAAVVVKREFFPAPGVTVQNFKRLHFGMAEEKVEAILGQKGVEVKQAFKMWTGDGCEILIFFGWISDYTTEYGFPIAVEGFCDYGSQRLSLTSEMPTSLLRRLRAWLGT